MFSFKDEEKEKLLQKKKLFSTEKTKMKTGEYELHILVEATSGLFTGDREEALDVIISMQAFGKKHYTSVKQAVGFQETFWGEHVYFQTKFDDTSIAEGQKLLISVHNRKKKLIEALIGNYQLSIGTIYSSKNHCIMHRWLALSNVEMAFTQVVGYIKISVSMLGENDKSLQLEPEPITGITKEKNVMIPPTIERKNYQLSVQIFQGEYVIPADGKTCDPYVGVQFGHLFCKTDPVMKNTNPIWLQTVYVPLSLPAVNQNISLRLNDFNYIQKIQVLGSYYINIFDLVAKYEALKKRDYKKRRAARKARGESVTSKESSFYGSDTKTIEYVPQNQTIAINKTLPYTQMQWINFYGPAADAQNGQHKNIYQFFPQLAPHYVGSALIRVNISQKDRPQRKVIKFKGSLPKQKKLNFEVIASIGSGINLYEKSKPYMIVVKIGHFEMETDYEEAINGFCCWNVKKSMGVSFYQNQRVPDLFVYLVDERGDKVCFVKYDPFPNGEEPDMDRQITILEQAWVMLKPDLSKIVIQNEQAGYLKLGLTIARRQKKLPIKQNRLKTGFMGFEQTGSKGRLVIQLICAEQIMPLDEEGTSDPFFQFTFMDKMVYSSTKQETLNPIYFQKLIIQTDISSDCQKLPPLIVNAYDKDRFSREFIGTTFINLMEGIKAQDSWAVYGIRERPEPTWFELRQNNVVSGKFLASFVLIPKLIEDIPKTINMATEKFVVTMLMLGVRGLRQNSILPIKNPYLIIDIDSFQVFEFYKSNSSSITQASSNNNLPKQQAPMTQNIVTEPQEINQILNLKIIEKRTIRLPSNPNYWPALSAKVKNEVMPGLYEPLLGYFSINLKEAYEKTLESKALFDSHSQMEAGKLDTCQFQENEKLYNVDEGVLLTLRNAILISLNYSWPVMSRDIELNNEHSEEKYDSEMVVVFPCYQEVEKGKEYLQLHKDILQENGCYMKIGFDDNKARGKTSLLQRNKHYRFVLNCSLEDYELEKTGKKIGMFDECPIRTGRMYPSNSIASNLLKKFTEVDRYIGKYKGHCFIEKADQVESSEITAQEREKLRNFLRVQKFHMYLYILEAFNLPDKDILSKSDPYLVVKVGEKTFNFEQEYFEDNDNPQFNKKVYKLIELPEDAILEIEVWDYDHLLGDDFIGSCIVDLENRAFYQENNVVFNNPIETHKLLVKESKIPQGSLRFWLDLVPHQKHSLYRQFEIGSQLDSEFEVRVIIWNCSDIPDNDIEGMSDLYVTCTFNNETQSTDTHVRAATGFGSFNWRCVYNVRLPTNDTFLSFRVFDRDLLTSNDYICSTTFSISHILDEAFETREPKKLYIGKKDLTKYDADAVSAFKVIDGQKRYDRFEIPLQAKSNSKHPKENQVQNIGKLELTVQVVPKALAEKKKVGKGRDSPNQFPYLAEPKDRFQWSWNPLTLMSRLCGRSFRYKMCLMFAISFIIFIFYNFIHSFGGATTANVMTYTTDKIIN